MSVGSDSQEEAGRGSMLHVGAYQGRHGAWFGVRDIRRPRNRIDPTPLLLALRRAELESRGG